MRLGLALMMLAALGPAASAQIWPEKWAVHTRDKVLAPPPADALLWSELGGEATESAAYNSPVGKFTAAAYRLPDSTAALAFYQAIRPENAVPVRGALMSALTPGGQYLAHKNYVFVFQGWRPLDNEMQALYGTLPKMRSGGGLPKLVEFLPEKYLVRNSERYILGLESLARFAPEMPGNLVGFEDSVEAAHAKYRIGGRELPLLLLEYPTPQLARRYYEEFEKRQGWALKRSGPFIAVIAGADAKAAAPVLDQVSWNVNLTLNEATKFVTAQDVGKMMMAIFELAGFLLIVCLGGGIAFAGIWIYLRRRRFAIDGTDAEATFLHLE